MNEAQIENAIQIAWAPQANQSLYPEAISFLHTLRNDPAASQPCLSIFVRTSPPASEVVRHTCLEIVGNAAQSGSFDSTGLEYLRTGIMRHVQQRYSGNSEADSPAIQNKLAQTITFLFSSLYPDTWSSFFDDFLQLAKEGSGPGTASTVGCVLFLRLLGSIHDEIADVMIVRSDQESKRNSHLKDLIRERDARKVTLFWQEILSRWRHFDPVIVEMCLRAVSRWVSWIDISLVVNQTIIDSLLEMAGQQGLSVETPVEVKLRDAAIGTFTEIVSKKMRPAEKVELIGVLDLGNVVRQLTESPALQDYQSTPKYDTDLAEAVAKLVNNVLRDTIAILDATDIDPQVSRSADEILRGFVPFAIRFFADDYDEVCSTVLDAIGELLSFFRKMTKSKSLPLDHAAMLQPILNAIVAKMKYDETASWGEDDDIDEAEFLDLRKRLNILQQQVASIDEGLYVEMVSVLAVETFDKFRAAPGCMDWRDLELALYEMFQFGPFATQKKGLYHGGKPSTPAAERLVVMMAKLMESNAGSYNHPAVQLQYVEICVRYHPFFEKHPEFIPGALESFVLLAHTATRRVQMQTWYSFLRYVRSLRKHLGDVAQTIIQSISDLLVINAQPFNERGDDGEQDDGSEDMEADDPTFNSQLYLFEALGCVISAPSIPVDTKVLYCRSIVEPIFGMMNEGFAAARAGDERAIQQVHHGIMALGNIAHGFTDWTGGGKAGEPPPAPVSDEFLRCAEAIIMALESLNTSYTIRNASRHAFSRLLRTVGAKIFPQLPRWIDGLLSRASSKEETAFFLRVLGQLIHAFKMEISEMLEAVLTPLLSRIFVQLDATAKGTDDEHDLLELKREFLGFILVCLNNNLASVFVSEANRAALESVISALEVYAQNPSDLPTARISFVVLTKMVSTWGGPDIAGRNAKTTEMQTAGSPQNPQPVVPGFDTFAVQRLSPLSWGILLSPTFKAGQTPTARSLVQDIASFQQEIWKKTGRLYVENLASSLREMGVAEDSVQEYLGHLSGELKPFQGFLVRFTGEGR